MNEPTDFWQLTDQWIAAVRELMGAMEKEIKTLRSELAAHQEEAVAHFIAREELKEALRKAILWAECAARRIDDRDDLNWAYLEDARIVYHSLPNNYAKHPQTNQKNNENT